MKMLDDILMAHTGVESVKRGGSPRELDLNRVPPAAMWRNDACRGPVTPHLRHVQRIDALGRDLGRRVLDRTHGRHIRCLGPLARLGARILARTRTPDVRERTDMKNQLCEDARRWAIGCREP